MKNLRQISIFILALILLGSTSPALAQGHFGESAPSQVTQELAKLEPYVQYINDDGIRLQAFDATAALDDGFSIDVVLLAQEMVMLQNDMAKLAVTSKIKDITDMDIPLKKYARVAKFFDEMTQRTKDDKSNTRLDPSPLASTAPACGDWDYPVPNYTPTWSFSSSVNPEQALLNLGFHRTAFYACGRNCTDNGIWIDFTRGRGYSGPYGYCKSPIFRDQGRIENSSAFKIQYGEPNPEISSYIWPYWNWGVYCRWWHDTF